MLFWYVPRRFQKQRTINVAKSHFFHKHREFCIIYQRKCCKFYNICEKTSEVSVLFEKKNNFFFVNSKSLCHIFVYLNFFALYNDELN